LGVTGVEAKVLEGRLSDVFTDRSDLFAFPAHPSRDKTGGSADKISVGGKFDRTEFSKKREGLWGSLGVPPRGGSHRDRLRR
jgi:hypothetical protein